LLKVVKILFPKGYLGSKRFHEVVYCFMMNESPSPGVSHFTMKYFLGFLLILIIILLNFKLLIFDYNFYEKNSENNPDFNKEIIINLINYLANKENLNNKSYTSEEIFHLEDVKLLINKVLMIFYFLLILFFLLILRYYKELPKIFIIFGSFFIILGLIMLLINFSKLFYNFHLIFFNNDLWLLSPETTLIKLFPEIFFKRFIEAILVRSFFISLILMFIGSIMRFKGIFRA